MTLVPFRSKMLAPCLAFVAAVGCGGATPPAETPRAAHAENSDTAKAKEKPAKAPVAEVAEEKPADPVITRTVADRVFAPRIAYMVNYPVSGAKDVADAKCTKKFPAPEAKAACMEKERNKFTADVLIFKKTDEGQWVSIFKRNGNALAQMSKSKVALGEDTVEKLAIKVEDDHGWRPLFAGKKGFEVKFRDEYSIELEDPQYGRLVYDARIGLIDD